MDVFVEVGRAAGLLRAAAGPAVYGPDDAAPEVDGERIVRWWGRGGDFGVAELEGGGHVGLTKRAAERDFAGRLRSIEHLAHRDAPRGLTAWPEEALPALFHERPEWGRLWRSAVGRPVPDGLPWAYRMELKALGMLPFERASDVFAALERKGWKKQKVKGQRDEWAKRFGSVKVSVESDWMFPRTLWVGAAFPAKLPLERFDEFKEATGDRLEVGPELTLDDVERAAKRVAAVAKRMSPKRQRKDRSLFLWDGLEGEDGLREWTGLLRDRVAEVLRTLTRRWEGGRAFPTRVVQDEVLESHGMMPVCGLDRKEARAKVRYALERLAKDGGAFKFTGGRKVEWKWKETVE